MSEQLLDAARSMHRAGISVVPVKADGTKRPAGAWKRYQSGRATTDELDQMFGNGAQLGVGLVTGKVSGNLEMTEVEGRAAARLRELTELARASGLGDLWDRLNHGWIEASPSGGVHWFYRLREAPPGNVHIARRPATATELAENPRERLKVLAETRGEGGFVVTAPSNGTVHPSGKPWTRIAGGPAMIPTITADEREQFHNLLASVGEEPPEEEEQPQLAGDEFGIFTGSDRAERDPRAGVSPGDGYEENTDWATILTPEGWTHVFTRGRTRYWRRPGKSTGVSATTGRAFDRDRFFVFSSSTQFEQQVPYTKFGAYALLHHGGDHSAAATALYKDYGKPAETTVPAAAQLPASSQAAEPEPAPGQNIPEAKPAEPAAAPAAPRIEVTDGALATVHPIAAKRAGPADSTLETSDDGNALALINQYGDRLRYCPDRGRWLAWNGHTWRWQPAGGGEARELAKDIARALPNDDRKHKKSSLSAVGTANMLAQAQTDPRITVDFADLDAHPWELNTPGGIIDLRSGELRAPDPAKLHTRSTKVTPDFGADPTAWFDFLEDTFPNNPELTDYMQRLVGYSAVGEVLAHILPFAFGDGGNGKGVFLEAIATVLGDYATSSPNGFLMASNYSQHTTEIARLAGARMVLCSEVNEGDKFDEAKVKLLTGGDRLTARFMRQDDFTFRPTHHLWLAGNHQPGVESGGDGFWRRLRLIPFIHKVPEEKIVDDLQGILAAEHGPAILAWIAQGAAIFATDGLAEPAQVRTATKAYAAAVDTVGRFIEDDCITGPGARDMSVKVTAMRAAYDKWCLENGETPVKGRALTTQLARHGVRTGREAPRGHAGARMYGGIGLLAHNAYDSNHDGDRGGW